MSINNVLSFLFGIIRKRVTVVRTSQGPGEGQGSLASPEFGEDLYY
jgi:hypothetical protein